MRSAKDLLRLITLLVPASANCTSVIISFPWVTLQFVGSSPSILDHVALLSPSTSHAISASWPSYAYTWAIDRATSGSAAGEAADSTTKQKISYKKILHQKLLICFLLEATFKVTSADEPGSDRTAVHSYSPALSRVLFWICSWPLLTFTFTGSGPPPFLVHATWCRRLPLPQKKVALWPSDMLWTTGWTNTATSLDSVQIDSYW